MYAGIWLRVGAASSVLVVAVLGGLFTASPAAAATSTTTGITLDPTHGPPRTSVQATVTCGQSDGGWDVTISGLTATAVSVGIGPGAGSVTATLTVPADAQPGARSVDAGCTAVKTTTLPPPAAVNALVTPHGLPSSVPLSAVFTVDPAPVAKPTMTAAPDSGMPGADVTLTGDQLPPCRAWTVLIADISQIPTVRSLQPVPGSEPTLFQAVFVTKVPADAAKGVTSAELVCGQLIAQTPFEVLAPKPQPQPQPVPQPQPQPQPVPQPQPDLTVVVPDLTGLPLADAAVELAGRQLVLAPGAVADRGSVTGQHPAAGTRVAPGTAVTVEQAAPVAISGRGALTLPGVGLGVLALGVAAVVARAGRAKAGREWAQQHVRVVVRRRAVRR